MFENYQRYANALPGRVVGAEDQSLGQGVNMWARYQGQVSRAPGRVVLSDNVQAPYSPIHTSARVAQGMVNVLPGDVRMSQQLNLGTLGRSGSMMRSVWVGDQEPMLQGCTTCGTRGLGALDLEASIVTNPWTSVAVAAVAGAGLLWASMKLFGKKR